MTAPAVEGRRFTASRRVRLGDVTASGRLRLDALARYLQDVASDDAADAAMPGDAAWVVRRTTIALGALPRLRDPVTLTTWCSGTGARWAERSTRLESRAGDVLATAVALWVHVDLATGRPVRLHPRFAEVYGPSAAGRTVRARLLHPDPPADAPEREWPLRRVDIDVLAHVNNAAYWAPVEELVGERTGRAERLSRAELEYRGGLALDEPVTLAYVRDDASLRCWMRVAGDVRASAVVTFAGVGSGVHEREA
ncbi:MAG TPA: acyl-ACP thioesterase domain-containing protein [Acidimicrobiia bacterium]|nr:acyl-ACP thioesterase domain-containing protein [Acidimicrobiia bacterium]